MEKIYRFQDYQNVEVGFVFPVGNNAIWIRWEPTEDDIPGKYTLHKYLYVMITERADLQEMLDDLGGDEEDIAYGIYESSSFVKMIKESPTATYQIIREILSGKLR